MAIKEVGLSWIVVSDLAKAKKFYTEVVGLQVSSDSEEYGWVELVGQNGGSLLGLAQANEANEPIPAGKNAVVTLTVENIEKAKNEMNKKGTQFIGDIVEVPGHVKLQLFSDKDGNLFQIAELLSGSNN